MKLNDYLPFCYAMAGSDSTVALYQPYWLLLGEELGGHELEDIKPGQIRMVAKLAWDKQAAKRRVNHQNGLYAQEHLTSAARALFRWAIDDELVTTNPALKVENPKRPT